MKRNKLAFLSGFALCFTLLIFSTSLSYAVVYSVTTSGPSTGTAGGSATFNIIASYSGSTPLFSFQIQYPDGSWHPPGYYTSTYTITNLVPGQYRIDGGAIDPADAAAGRWNKTVSQTKYLTVTAPVTLSSITLSPSSAAIQGTNKSYGAVTVMANYSNGTSSNVTGSAGFSSSNSNIAYVSGSTLYSGSSAGTSTITASYQGKTSVCSVTVSSGVVNSVTVSGPTTANAGSNVTFTVSASYTGAAPLYDIWVQSPSGSWTSSGQSATYTINNVVAGQYQIDGYAWNPSNSSNKIKKTVYLTVTAPVTLSSISISPTSYTITGTNTYGSTVRVMANYSNGTSSDVTSSTTFTSNKSNVAYVSSGSIYSGSSTGSATITAAYQGKTAACSVTVSQTKTLSSITMSPNTLNIPNVNSFGSAITITAKYSDSTTQTIPNSSVTFDGNNIAYVQNGNIYSGNTTGTVIITAAYQSVKTTCTVIVGTSQGTITGVSLSGPTSSTPGNSAAYTATATYTSGTPWYAFSLKFENGTWNTVQDYSTKNTYTITNLKKGTYYLVAYALDKTDVAAQNWSKAKTSTIILYVGSKVSAVTLSGPTTAVGGGSVTYTASATCSSGTPMYSFWVQPPNGSWSCAQDYSTKSTFALSSLQAGTYNIAVNALEQSDVIAANWGSHVEDNKTLTVSQPGSDSTPPTISVSQPSGSTIDSGSKITITANDASGIQTIKYKWDGNSYTTSSTSSIDITAPNAPGSHTLYVTATDNSAVHNPTSTLQYTYTVKQAAITGVNLSGPTSANPTQSATYTATATYTSGTPWYGFSLRFENGSYNTVQNYSSNNKYTITNLQKGTYYLVVSALDKTDVAAQNWSNAKTSSIILYVVPKVSAVTLSGPATATPGGSVTYTASATCSSGTPNYAFWVLPPNGSWSCAQDYSTKSTFALSSLQAGTYTVAVNALEQADVAAANWGWSVECSKTLAVQNGTVVTVPVTGVSVSPTSLPLTAGGATGTLTATVSPSNATNKAVTWSSSNTSVATVSFSGVVTPISSGSAVITVTTVDGGKTATCNVTVVSTTIPVTGVSLNKTSTSINVGASDTLTATVAPANATNKNVTWSSDKPAIATVNNGKVTGVSAGTAVITVTTVDGGKTATCNVTINAAAQTTEQLPIYIVPVNTTFTVYMMNEFSGTDTWAIPGDSNTYTNKVTVTPMTGQGYTVLTGSFNGQGPKFGTIGAGNVKVNFFVVPAPDKNSSATVKFSN